MQIIGILKQNIRYIWRYWLRCIGIFTGILSVLFLFVSWDDIGVQNVFRKVMLLTMICLLLLIWAVLWVCIFKKQKVIWQSASGRIIVRYGDILQESFNLKNRSTQLYVIPVNSAFDTIVDSDISKHIDPLVSPNSLHGRWIKKMIDNGKRIEDIDRAIQSDLNRQAKEVKKVYTSEEKKRGNKVSYELGTIATVKGQAHNTFLLLALTDFDKNNNAHVSVDDYERVIKALLDFYEHRGQGHELIIPLMGTNFANAGLNHEDSLRTITSIFRLRGNKIRGDVNIVIFKGDKDKVSIDV